MTVIGNAAASATGVPLTAMVVLVTLMVEDSTVDSATVDSAVDSIVSVLVEVETAVIYGL